MVPIGPDTRKDADWHSTPRCEPPRAELGVKVTTILSLTRQPFQLLTGQFSTDDYLQWV
jgi:hypothetical protein